MNVNVPRVGDGVGEIDWTRIDTPLERVGKKIILPNEPDEMPIGHAITTLQRIQKAESQTYTVLEVVKGLPWDAAVAVYKAMQLTYGVALPETIRRWYGDTDPTFLTVRIGHKPTDVIQVPVGQFTLPTMGAKVHVYIDADGANIHSTVTLKDRARIIELANLARQLLNTESIYKGKAIALKVDEDGDLDINEQPDFFDVSNVKESDMIHNKVTADIIQTSILAPLKHSAACRKHGIPLKRGILLEGRYGCGKTLTARVTAAVAQANAWTFINLERPNGLKAAIETARMYQPCVIFAEDIDRFGDRDDEDVNDLINLLDGLVPAGSEIMTILTTNHVERIDKAMLRPGRLDAVISIDAPDAEAVQRLIRHYGGANLPADVNLEAVGEALAGQVPASVAEVVKRGKLAMLTEDRTELTEADLVTAAQSAVRHLALLADIPAPKTVGDRLAECMTELLGGNRDAQAQEVAEEMDITVEGVSALRARFGV